MASGGGVTATVTQSGTLLVQLAAYEAKARVIVKLATEVMAPKAEAHMRSTAPWTDRTGNARNGLRATSFGGGDEAGIILSHSVFYGVYLENRWDGRYAVIKPTISVIGPELMALVGTMLRSI